MKSKLGLTLFGLLWTFQSVVAANGGSVRGGGHVVEIGRNRYQILDFLTDAKCDWTKTGKDLISDNPVLQMRLKKLAQVDWYFSRDLKQQIEAMGWCFTGALKYLPPIDDDTIFVQNEMAALQAAIRLDNDAYIDEKKWKRYSLEVRADLVIHEAMHTYLAMDTVMRVSKLHTLVNLVREIAYGRVRDLSDFNRTMIKSNALYSSSVSELTPFKTSIVYATADLSEKMEILKSEKNLGAIYSVSKENQSRVRSLLSVRHQDKYDNLLGRLEYDLELIALNCKQASDEYCKVIIEVVKGGRGLGFNLLSLLHSSREDFPQALDNILYTSNSYKNLEKNFVNSFDQMETLVKDQVIHANAAMGILIDRSDSSSSFSITELRPSFETYGYRRSFLLDVAVLVEQALNAKDEVEVERLLRKGGVIRGQFEFKKVLGTVDRLEGVSERLKNQAKRTLRVQGMTLEKALKETLKSNLDQEQYQLVKKYFSEEK